MYNVLTPEWCQGLAPNSSNHLYYFGEEFISYKDNIELQYFNVLFSHIISKFAVQL